jgi:glycosyltransferase involved in cell wall biosynthesis
MIYLSPEHRSALGEDTFWTWFQREFRGSAFGMPDPPQADDVILRYSTLGASPYPERTVALLWELHPEMKSRLLSSAWDGIIEKINACARTSRFRVVSCSIMLPYYDAFGASDVLPIGVDTNLFRPMDKAALRRKHGIPVDRPVGFWCGTTHPMKGFDNLVTWRRSHPDVHFIIVWKNREGSARSEGVHSYVRVSQAKLAELMNCADFYLSCGRLRPFFMVEWEAMACNLPMVVIAGEPKEFAPSANPRDDVFARGWDRKSAKTSWERFLKRTIREISSANPNSNLETAQ